MADLQLIKDFAEVLRQKDRATQPYDTTAEVTRVDEDGVAWVHIPGGADETPVQMSINAREGDTVRVRVAGGQAWLVGNDTAPPTDDRTANEAIYRLDRLEAIDIIAKLIKADGINADWITTGSISADRISGGKLTVGGDNDVNGFIEVLDSQGNSIIYINYNGFTSFKNNEFVGNEHGVNDPNMGYFPTNMYVGNYFPYTSSSGHRLAGFGISGERGYSSGGGHIVTEGDILFELFADVEKDTDDSSIKINFRDTIDFSKTAVGAYEADMVPIMSINEDGISMESDTSISGPDNLLFSLDTSRTVPGSTDYALYEAILALGWQNDVID